MTSDLDDPRNRETLDAPPSSRGPISGPVSSRRPQPSAGFTTRWFGDPAEKSKRREPWKVLFVVLLLLLLSYAFRIPPLLNARSTNSDAAVVGLQAMHVLRGEHSPFLWGSGYQTSADAIVAAGFFKVLGPTPFALMFSALTLHVIATVLVFWTLRRRLPTGSSFVLTLPLVFSPSSVHTYALYPPRQTALTLALAALWAIGGAGTPIEEKLSETKRLTWLFVGGALMTLAISADPYPLLLVPITLLFAFMVAKSDVSFGDMLKRMMPFVSGALAGLVPFVLLRRSAGATSGPMGLTTNMLGHHFELLVKECLPWALSYKVYYAKNVMDYAPWQAPLAVETIQIAGALVVLVVVLYALGAPFLSSLPWPVRRFGLIGGLTYPLAIGAFLVSVMSMDHFSMRYLAVLTLMLPFAAAPAAAALGARRVFAVLGLHLIASAIGGWVGYGPFVKGIVPVRQTPELADDYALADLMRSKGLTYAMADYWASYRLTFLFQEKIIVVPTNESEDRYAPYRRAFEKVPVYAYVFDPGRSREKLEEIEKELVTKNASVEKTKAGGHTVFFVTRGAPPPIGVP